MLVDVVEMDVNGRQRSREELLAARPVRGRLKMERIWTDRHLERAPVHAELMPMQLETLYRARIEKWRGTSMVLAGWQRQPWEGRRSGGGTFPQRWWVRLVLDDSEPPRSWLERREAREARGA